MRSVPRAPETRQLSIPLEGASLFDWHPLQQKSKEQIYTPYIPSLPGVVDSLLPAEEDGLRTGEVAVGDREGGGAGVLESLSFTFPTAAAAAESADA